MAELQHQRVEYETKLTSSLDRRAPKSIGRRLAQIRATIDDLKLAWLHLPCGSHQNGSKELRRRSTGLASPDACGRRAARRSLKPTTRTRRMSAAARKAVSERNDLL